MFDVHCHILHDVDDGSGDLQESLRMLRAAQQAGITGMVCTPHCRGRRFDYQRILSHYGELRPHAEQMGMRMDLGFEVYWEKLLEIGLDWIPRLGLGESGLFLLELGYGSFPPRLRDLVARIQSCGFNVIIAHPERYACIQNSIEKAYQLKELGCYLQLSGNCVSGGRFDARCRAASAMLREGLIDYVASDAHCPGDYAMFERALDFARRF